MSATDKPQWTVSHVGCKFWFRDMVVNALGNDSLSHASGQFDRVHEAIRDSIDMDRLIAHLGPDFVQKEL